MRNADEIINALEDQREEKLKQIDDLRNKIDALEDEVETLEQLLNISASELAKFASVITGMNIYSPRRNPSTPRNNQGSTVRAVRDITDEAKQRKEVPKKELKKNTGLGGIIKKKDRGKEEDYDYEDEDDNEWGDVI